MKEINDAMDRIERKFSEQFFGRYFAEGYGEALNSAKNS